MGELALPVSRLCRIPMARIFPGPGGHATSEKSLSGLPIATFFALEGHPLYKTTFGAMQDGSGNLIMESISEKIRRSLFYRIRDKTRKVGGRYDARRSDHWNDPKMYTRPWVAMDKFPMGLEDPHKDVMEQYCSPTEMENYNKIFANPASAPAGQSPER
jgi:hypothetical protein